MLTMKWHKEPDLSALHPLPDAVPCALLHASDEGGVVDYTVEDLPTLVRLHGDGRIAVLRDRSRASVALHDADLVEGGWVAIVGISIDWVSPYKGIVRGRS